MSQHVSGYTKARATLETRCSEFPDMCSAFNNWGVIFYTFYTFLARAVRCGGTGVVA
jgi:hypothetical protein